MKKVFVSAGTLFRAGRADDQARSTLRAHIDVKTVKEGADEVDVQV